MSRLTRDYKKPQRRSPDLTRLREFGAGVLVGAVLAAGVLIYMKDSAETVAESAPRPEPRRTPASDEESAASGETPENYDF